MSYEIQVSPENPKPDMSNIVRHTDALQYRIEFNRERLELLKSMFCKDSSDDEFNLFVHACQRTGLDPFMKQIHALKRWDGASKKNILSIQTGIDGYRLIAERTGKYMPGPEPTYQYDSEGKLFSSTAYIKKLDARGEWHTIAATAFYDEYVATTKEGKPNHMWATRPRGQLAKCAEALVLRKGFPADLSGVYTREEMEQADNPQIEAIAHVPSKAIISQEQFEVLNDLIGEDENYRRTFMDFLRKKGIASLSSIPLEMYDRCLDSATKYNAKKQQQLQLQQQYASEISAVTEEVKEF